MSDAAFLPRARRKHLGLTPRQERTFNLLAAGLMSVMVLGWAVSIGDQYVQREELWQRLLALCPPEHQELMRLKRDGLSLDEIAVQTGLHRDSVRRILRTLARPLRSAIACFAIRKREGQAPPPSEGEGARA